MKLYHTIKKQTDLKGGTHRKKNEKTERTHYALWMHFISFGGGELSKNSEPHTPHTFIAFFI